MYFRAEEREEGRGEERTQISQNVTVHRPITITKAKMPSPDMIPPTALKPHQKTLAKRSFRPSSPNPLPTYTRRFNADIHPHGHGNENLVFFILESAKWGRGIADTLPERLIHAVMDFPPERRVGKVR